jgi:hypothetical protein
MIPRFRIDLAIAKGAMCIGGIPNSGEPFTRIFSSPEKPIKKSNLKSVA